MTLKESLILLTASGLLTGLAAGLCALSAALVKSKPDPVVAMLRPGARPDDQAGDAAVIGMWAFDDARMLREDAQAAAPLNRAAAILTIVSVILTSIAGFLAALAL